MVPMNSIFFYLFMPMDFIFFYTLMPMHLIFFLRKFWQGALELLSVNMQPMWFRSKLGSISGIKNEAVNRLFIELRERTGQTIIPQQGALRTLIARFRNNGKAAFVLDQNTSELEGGIRINFLGLPMLVSPVFP